MRHNVDTSMMAWRVHEFGPPEAMKFERVPRPVPGPGEVVVKVHAAGVGCLYPLFIRALKQRRARCSGHEGRRRAGAE